MAEHVLMARVASRVITSVGRGVRWYAKKYKTPLEDSRTLAAYRRQITELRRKYREEWEKEQVN